MKKTLLISLFLASLTLASCTVSVKTISTNEIFEGYPCLDNCSGFKTGFESARDQKFTEEVKCRELPQTNRLGCLSYMHEFRLFHDQPAEYIFPSASN